jgi:hypothetical protein
MDASAISTAQLADACVRLGIELRPALSGIRPNGAEYLERHAAHEGHTFREHLSAIGGAIEE